MFASQFPSFIFSLWGGIVADKNNRYKVLLITQIASMLQATLLAVLVLTGHYTVWTIIVLSSILGIINAFDVPARQPLVHELVKNKKELPNALALNSAMVNFARLAGPALSGILLQKLGAGACFLFNAISFVAVITSLLLLKLPPYNPTSNKTKASSDLAGGFTYLKQTPAIGIILLMLILMSFFVFPFDALLPVFAKAVFHGDAATYGYIRSFIGLGAIVSTFFLASLKPEANLRTILFINSIVLGIGLILFSHTANFHLAMLFAVLAGFGAMSQSTIYITILQVATDANMRGRIMSFFAMATFGMLPLGSLFIGAVSRYIGAPNTLMCQGLAGLIITVAFSSFLLRQRSIRRIA